MFHSSSLETYTIIIITLELIGSLSWKVCTLVLKIRITMEIWIDILTLWTWLLSAIQYSTLLLSYLGLSSHVNHEVGLLPHHPSVSESQISSFLLTLLLSPCISVFRQNYTVEDSRTFSSLCLHLGWAFSV